MSAHDGGACAGTGAVRRAAAAPAPRRPTSARGATQLAYVLMHDKKGWTSLAAAGADAYLRVHGSDLPDVDVEKGTLVEVDPEGDFDPRTNISVNVVSLDRPEIKISLLMKELLPIEEGVYQRLLPLRPQERYDVMTDERRSQMLGAGVGDTVYCVTSAQYKEVGMVQYVGPVKGLGRGVFYGIELLDSKHGKSDGRYLHRQYFMATPFSSVFVSVAHLYYYDDRQPTQPARRPNSLISFSQFDGDSASAAIDRLKIVEGRNSLDADDTQSHHRGKGGVRPHQQGARRAGDPDRGGGVDLGLDDRVVWLSDSGPEYGWVRWMGHCADTGGETELLAGIEFDNPVGNGNGVYKGKRLFHTQHGHASLMPLEGLLRAEDLDGDGGGSSGGALDAPPPRRVEGRRKARQREKERRRPTPHSEDRIVDRENEKENCVPPAEGLQDQQQQRPCVEDDRNPLLEKRSLADKAVITSLKGKRRPPTPPRSSSPTSPSSPSPPSSSSSAPPPPRPPPAPEPPAFDRLDPRDTCNNHKDLEVGCLVELRCSGAPCFGVVRWIGWLAEHDRTGVGVELEEDMIGASNGWHRGTQLFACPEGRAVFVPFANVRPDNRFGSRSGRGRGRGGGGGGGPDKDDNGNDGDGREGDFGGMECPAVTGFYTPIKVSSLDNLLAKVVGRNKGIQGHQNSCYLDATLFAMFSFTSVFDSLLYRPPSPDDIVEYTDVQKVLREEIVNPLRKNLFVRADKVMKLRKLLDSLTSVKGLMSEEKDPEEFLNSLLTQTLRAAPFLELSSGQTAHLYQLFVEKQQGVSTPTVQELFEQSFRTSEVKLRKVPPVLILQMPRFGRQYKVYNRIVPSQILDVTDVIEDSPRQCIICGKLAAVECLECFGDHHGVGSTSGLDSTAFCEECVEPVHNHHKRKSHRIVSISVPEEFLSNRSSDSIPRLFMELFAVVCIETSHYVTFVKSGLGPDAPWCFFDSMADRKGEADGYNIPEVSEANDVLRWLSEEGARSIREVEVGGDVSAKSLPVHARRLICDGYMCFYQSPQVMMYN